jgi:NAD dependent epimerase/dehydratase
MAKRAFLTGAGGFIASHLTEALLKDGWQVTALIHYNSRNDWGWLEPLHRKPPANLQVLLGDIADPFLMREAVDGSEVVFHLAALISIPYSYQAPASYVQTNVTGTLNLAEAARKAGVKRFVHTSTSEVYGSARYTPLDEEHPLQGQSPYSASKIAADKLIESYVCSFGLPAVTVRPFNTYGPRQSARAVIPSIIAQALQGNTVRLGSLDTIRDLTFVSDTVAGFLRAAEAEGVDGQTINLGTGSAVSIRELAQTIFDLLGISGAIVTDPQRIRPATSEVRQLASDNRKAKKLLGWQPEVALKDGLGRTIEWMRQHPELYHPEEYAR